MRRNMSKYNIHLRAYINNKANCKMWKGCENLNFIEHGLSSLKIHEGFVLLSTLQDQNFLYFLSYDSLYFSIYKNQAYNTKVVSFTWNINLINLYFLP